MWHFGKQHIQNIIHLEEAEFDYGYVGITKIIGRNLKSSRKGRTNGAGKSLLFSVLPALLKNANPTHEKNKRSTKNSLLSAGSVMSLTLSNNEKQTLTITKSRKGKTISCKVVDASKKDLGLTTNTKAEEFIDKWFPLTEEELFSTVYVNSRRASTLLMGTEADRFKYLSRLFHLDDYDALYSKFRSLLADAQKDVVRKDTLLEQLENLGLSDEDLSSIDLRRELKETTKNVESGKAELKRLQKDRNSVEIYSSNKKNMSSYLTDLGAKKKELRALLAVSQQIEDYERYKDALIRYKEQKDSLETQVGKIQSKVGACSFKAFEKQVAKEQEAYSDRDKEIHVLLQKLRQNTTLASRIKEVLAELKTVKGKLKASDKCKDRSADIKHLQVHKKHLSNFLQNGGSSECTICGSKFSRSAAKKRLKTLDNDLSALEIEQADFLVHKKLVTKKRDLRQRAKELGTVPNIAKYEKKLSGLQKLQESSTHREKEKYLKEWGAIDRSLSALRKPLKVEQPDQDNPEKEIKELRKKINTTQVLEPSWSSIKHGEKIAGKNCKKTLRKLDIQIQALEETVKYNIGQCAKLEAEIKQRKKDREAYLELDEKVTKLKRKLRDMDLIEALIEAYGPKGLKTLVVQRLATVIEKNLNRYSHTLFPENFRFSMEVNDNQVGILVERPDDRSNTEPVDVRHLSGAESVCFSLLWLISILPLIPDNRRTNILILDEIEAGLDYATREMISTEFLPALQTVVPHIVFITPYLDIDVHDSRTIVVEKDKNGIGSVYEEEN